MNSPFFNPDECPFEVLGFVKEFTDAVTNKPLGSFNVETPDRPTGSPGLREETLTSDTVLTKGHRTVVVKASPKRPRRVITSIQIICGRVKSK